MKSLKLLLLLALPLFFTGCLEINEDITVTKTGSGKYAMKTEMGELMDMMQSFIPEEERSKIDLSRARDTTVLLKDYIDTTSSLTADEKSLFRDGSMHMKMNMAEKIMNVDMNYPFTSLANLQKLYVNMDKSISGFGSMLGGMGGAGGESPMPPTPSMNKLSSYYDLIADKSSISRKLNKERFAAMQNDSMMSQIKGMSAMGAGMGDMKMNMTVHLPSAAKSVTGAKASLSADKKTVLVQNNMLDVFDHPEYFEFSVQY